MPEIKFPQKELIISAFFGGMVLSMLELMNMLFNKEMVDGYYLGGMFVAGILGVFGLLVSQTKDLGGAITAGIAAPQILGGFAKTTGVVKSVTFFFLSLSGGEAYAMEEPEKVLSTDSVYVVAVAEKSDEILEIICNDSKVNYYLKDKIIFRVPKNEEIIVSSREAYMPVTFENLSKDTILMTVKVLERKPQIQQARSSKVFRGIFAQEVHKEEVANKQAELEPEEYIQIETK